VLMLLLSEIGISIAPLLGAAGVAGVAIVMSWAFAAAANNKPDAIRHEASIAFVGRMVSIPLYFEAT